MLRNAKSAGWVPGSQAMYARTVASILEMHGKTFDFFMFVGSGPDFFVEPAHAVTIQSKPPAFNDHC